MNLAVIGAGPAGLALALLAAERLPQASIHLFDTRPLDRDVSGDARTLALNLGSVRLLQRLSAWRPEAAQAIHQPRRRLAGADNPDNPAHAMMLSLE